MLLPESKGLRMGARDSERFQLLLSPILLTVRQFGQHRSMRMACKTQRQAQQSDLVLW